MRGGGLHFYRYVLSNPLRFTDPTGKWLYDPDGLAGRVDSFFGGNPAMQALLNYLQSSPVMIDIQDAFLPDTDPATYLYGEAGPVGEKISINIDVSKIKRHGMQNGGVTVLNATVHELLHARNILQGGAGSLWDEIRVRRETDDLTKPICQ